MKKWTNFILGCLILIGFIFLFPRLLHQDPTSNNFFQQVHQNDIDPSALFYSEEDHTSSSYKTLLKKLKDEKLVDH